MKKIINNIAIIAIICLLFTGCRGKQSVSNSYSYYDFGTTLINTSPSGTITMRAWGNGPNLATAFEEAKKNAVSEVLFKGFKTSKSPMASALINEVNARQRYEDYFDRFFADGGEYNNFVYEASSTDKSRTKSKSNGRENYGFTLVVDRNALRDQMKKDGILR